MHSLGSVVSAFAPQPWCAALGAGLLLLATATLAFRWRLGRGGHRTLPAASAATFLLATLFAVAFIEARIEQFSAVGAGWILGISLAICGTVGVSIGRLLRPNLQASQSSAPSIASIWLLLIAVNAVLLGLAVDQGVAGPSPPLAGGANEFDPAISAALQPVDGVYAVTDRGRVIPVYAAPVDARSFDPASGGAQWLSSHVGSFQMLVTQERDHRSNGHGLVFSAGHYWFDGRRVAEVLEDNGYETVSKPAPGDLIVYRDVSGRVVHTGIVKFLDEQGLILIDSKLPGDERGLHRPGAAGLSSFDRAYYRSARAGHALAMIDESDYPPPESGQSGVGADSSPAL